MGMVKQGLGPRVKDREETDVGPEVFRVGSDFEEGLGGGAEQDLVDDLLVAEPERSDLARYCEDDVEVGHREELLGAVPKPLRALVTEARGAVAIAAAVVRRDLVATGVATV